MIETKINAKLHSLPCNFSKKAGHIYTVYEKPSGECYLSMLSPQVIIILNYNYERYHSIQDCMNIVSFFCLKEWGNTCPHNFIGSYKLDAGMTWNPVDEYSAGSALQKWISSDENNAMMIEWFEIHNVIVYIEKV